MTIDFVWNKEENSPFPEEPEKQRFQTTKDFFRNVAFYILMSFLEHETCLKALIVS